MTWIWSDELASTLAESPDVARLIPESWTARPCAFSTRSGEDAAGLARRLLGLPHVSAEPDEAAAPPRCACSRSR